MSGWACRRTCWLGWARKKNGATVLSAGTGSRGVRCPGTGGFVVGVGLAERGKGKLPVLGRRGAEVVRVVV